MKHIVSVVLLWAAAAMSAAAGPAPFVARYAASVAGLRADVTTSLEAADDGTLIFETRTSARGIARLARPRDAVERSEFRRRAGRLEPLRFLSEDGSRRNKDGSTLAFDWLAGAALSAHDGDTRHIELSAGMMDRQLMQIALMDDLSRGLRQATYTIIDRHEIKMYHARVLREERVTVPAGEFDTVVVERAREGSSRTMLLWCAPRLDYLPVQMQQLKNDDVRIEMALTAYEQAPSAQQPASNDS